MSQERLIASSGQTCYAHIISRNASTIGYRWNGTSLESFLVANYSLYTVTATEEGATGIYVVTIPTGLPAGYYDIVLFVRAGGSPANGDIAISATADPVRWNGSTASSVVEQSGDTNYGDIKTLVEYNLGRREDSDVQSQMAMWARMATVDITTWRDGWFLDAISTVSTVDGQQTYDMPTDYKSNMKMMIRKTDRWVELAGPIDIVEAQRRFTPANEGEPEAWSHFGVNQFKVWPPDPGSTVLTLQLNYQRFLAALVDDDDTNTLTVRYPNLLVAHMTKWGFRYLQEWEDAKQWEDAADRIARDVHAEYVAKTLGRDFALTARTDVLGHADQSRGTANYIIVK